MSGITAMTAASATGANAGLGKWYAVSQGVSALATLAGGVSAMKAASAEAELQDAQGRLAMQEAERDAAQKAREVGRFQQRQAHAYASSGITLAGSPLLVLEQTRREGQQEVDAILKRGRAEMELMKQKSRMLRASGRNAMFGSVLGAAGKGAETYITGKRLGMFDSVPSTTSKQSYLPPISYFGPNAKLGGV